MPDPIPASREERGCDRCPTLMLCAVRGYCPEPPTDEQLADAAAQRIIAAVATARAAKEGE